MLEKEEKKVESDITVDPSLVKLLSGESRVYYVATVLGISVGALTMLAGILLTIFGLSGNIEWIIESGGLKSRLANASPGVFFTLLGAFVLWHYKPVIKYKYEISQTIDQDGRVTIQATKSDEA